MLEREFQWIRPAKRWNIQKTVKVTQKEKNDF